jgi:hypothetical protein
VVTPSRLRSHRDIGKWEASSGGTRDDAQHGGWAIDAQPRQALPEGRGTTPRRGAA